MAAAFLPLPSRCSLAGNGLVIADFCAGVGSSQSGLQYIQQVFCAVDRDHIFIPQRCNEDPFRRAAKESLLGDRGEHGITECLGISIVLQPVCAAGKVVDHHAVDQGGGLTDVFYLIGGDHQIGGQAFIFQVVLAGGVFHIVVLGFVLAVVAAHGVKLFLFPVGCSLAQVIMGFISDAKGRKLAALVTAFDCLVCFVGFWLGAKYNWSPAIVGLLCGGFVGSFYSTNDVLIMMIGESAPTNLRSSVMAAEFLPVGAGVALSYMVSFPLSGILGNQYIGIIALCLLVPGFVAALATLAKKTHDTKGINLDTVTGAEWD